MSLRVANYAFPFLLTVENVVRFVSIDAAPANSFGPAEEPPIFRRHPGKFGTPRENVDLTAQKAGGRIIHRRQRSQ